VVLDQLGELRVDPQPQRLRPDHHDRPSYDVAVQYNVLDGSWAQKRARERVPRAYRDEWPDLSPAQRDALIQRATAAYEQHVRDGWAELARVTGISEAELETSRTEAIRTIQRMHGSISDRNRQRELETFEARNGRKPDEKELRDIERRATGRLREMDQPRPILSRVNDRVAFACQSLVQEEVEIRPMGEEAGDRGIDRVERVPGLRVFDAGDRDYPMDSMTIEFDTTTLPAPIRGKSTEPIFLEGVGSHLIGWMRPVWTEDETRRKDMLAADAKEQNRAQIELPDGSSKDRGEYADGDRVGQAGIEGSMENRLRGLRGVRTRSLDSGRVDEVPPEPGQDVKLTIDMMLQARVQAAMTPSVGLARVQDWHRSAAEHANPTMPTGTPINGAAVVMDIDTGEIIAMVSTPPASQRLRRDDPDAVFDDPLNLPYLNRATDRPYPPGSIVKPLVLVEAIRRGIHGVDHAIECTGHLLPNQPNMLQCWIWKRYKMTHSSQLEHDLDGADAIMVSCNIFFFTLGRKLGTDGIRAVYDDFGVGKTWDLGIGPENPGLIGRGTSGTPLELGDAIQMGIGQGPITWTPLHAACAYATLARGGVTVTPRIIMNDPRGRRDSTKELGLDHAATAQALEGLRRSVNEKLGSGHLVSYMRNGVREEEAIFNTPGIRVIGKTGTATAPDLKIKRNDAGDSVEEENRQDESDGVNSTAARDRDDNGVEVVRSGDHSWFVVLAGREGDSPRYAVSVVMEYAGSGGRVSGPICNQIVKALVAEGYLTPAPVPSDSQGHRENQEEQN
jgi:penicillin-binding protein 2